MLKWMLLGLVLYAAAGAGVDALVAVVAVVLSVFVVVVLLWAVLERFDTGTHQGGRNA